MPLPGLQTQYRLKPAEHCEREVFSLVSFCNGNIHTFFFIMVMNKSFECIVLRRDDAFKNSHKDSDIKDIGLRQILQI